MNIARYFSSFLFLSLLTEARAEPFATWTNTDLTLSNGYVQRNIDLPAKTDGHFITRIYKPAMGEFKYFLQTNTDFQFQFDGEIYSGNSRWTLSGITRITDSRQGDGAAIVLISADKKLELTINFLLYPKLPLIRKSLTIRNLGSKEVSVESVDIEKFNVTSYWAPTFSWICSDYGRRRSIGPYDGNLQDALVTVHNSDWQQGIVIGNEASGVMKHTSVFWQELTICAGLTHKDATYPFRKYIAPGAAFTTPQVFTILYNNQKDPDGILNTAVPDFVRRHLGIRLSELKHKPTFIYNTWVPFKGNINEQLIRELAKSAAAAGMKEFVIDDGWQDNYGDWGIDSIKFPHGLKPVFEYIKSLGMKPGLWISVGSASSDSRVYKEHPEWFVIDKKGAYGNLQADGNQQDVRSACFGTGWKDYMKNILMKLSIDYGLEYMKLDFAIVTSAYRFDKTESGCYATMHPGHKDHHESLYSNYEEVWGLFDELHAAKPDLFIDCTFEAMGGLQLIDYAMLKHAEGNWLSNFNGPEAKVDLRIRNMAWWRSPAVPATALVIGNPEMQDTGWDLHIKSLCGALPIMLGDPRKLSAPDFAKYRQYADWLQSMENKHQVMSYRQDLPGFGEPMEGTWDGFERVNTESGSGGIIGVFRHGAIEAKRLVTVRHLDQNKTYQVKTVEGKLLTTKTGNQLERQGFEVGLPRLYDGILFEITELKK